MSNLKPKPWWLPIYGRWVTMYPYIYYPSSVNGEEYALKYPWVIAHETVHLHQQKEYSGGVTKWYVKYLTDKKFRLAAEVEAIAVELNYNLARDPRWVETTLMQYADELSGSSYSHAADSKDEAVHLLRTELGRISGTTV